MRWLRSLFLGHRLEREMQDEMRQHVDRATERLMARGLSSEEARRAALREFGNVHYLQEEARDARGGRWLEALTPDAKLALRMLVKSPLLSVVGGLGMAVAIAIATSVFALMMFYYSDPPVEDGDRLVTVAYIDGDDTRSTLFDYRLWKDELESIQDLAAYRSDEHELEGPGVVSGQVEVAEMTASAFRAARVPPLLGRPLLDSDEVEGAPPVAVIGYREWHQRFGADPAVVGREVRLDGTVHTVVGVMPEHFRLPANHGFWTALMTRALIHGPAGRSQLRVFGRLAPGVDAAAAKAELAVIGERMVAEYPEFYDRPRAVVVPFVHHLLDLDGAPAWAIWLMQVFVGLILLAVAINVAVLFYARTARRRVEITVRTALGASRSRIVTQLFLEALALSAMAAPLGLLIAQVGFSRLTLLDDLEEFPYWVVGGLPAETILYAAGLAVLAALVVGVLPALQSTGRHLQAALREMGGGTGLRMGRTWTVLICVQVAVAVGVLPAVTGVAWNYFWTTPTFPASEILVFRLQRPPALHGAVDSVQSEPNADYRFLQAELLRRVEAIPEVSSVTFGSAFSWRSGPYVRIEVEGATEARELTGRSRRVDVEYFDVLGGTLLAGRTFERADAVDGATAAIVTRAFVNEYLAGGPALGRRFREMTPAENEVAERGPWFEIVGVVEDMMRPSRGTGRTRPEMYHPIALGTHPLELAARTSGINAASIAPRVREIAGEVAPGLELRAFPLDEHYYGDVAEIRLIQLTVGVVTLSVLLLSAAGISAMMSFAVTQRQREVGIRTALGATRRQVLASVFSRAIRQLGTGLLIGAAGAALLDRLTGGDMLEGEAVPLLALVAAIMLLSGLLATLGPARRALRIQPMEALREE